MRLQDSIAISIEPVHVEYPGHANFVVPSAAAISASVRQAPIRYVLDDAVAATVGRAAFEDPAQLMKCMDLFRIPAPLMWLEWSEEGRRAVMAELGLSDAQAFSRQSHRAGMLVRSNPGSRSGEIFVAWDGETSTPDLSPFVIEFDLDNPAFATLERADHITRSLRIGDSDEVSHLLSHARFRLNPDWRKFYEAVCTDSASLDAALRENLLIVAADFPFFVAFCLLVSARNAVAYASVDLAKLNASRAKRGREPLLNHIEVKARLGSGLKYQMGRFGGSRSASRLHFVSGHLVRRGVSVFWRRAHVRGNPQRGVISTRTVIIQGDAGGAKISQLN
jgi:hypothetical protein